MAEFPALPLWTDAYLGDTTHLTTTEHGAYLLLLMVAWRTTTCDLPDDDKLLARYARLTPGQWKRVKPTLEPFFKVQNGRWINGRLLDEREAVRRQVQQRSNAGKSSALKRKHRGSTGVATESQRNGNTHTHTHKRLPDGKRSAAFAMHEGYQLTDAYLAASRRKGFDDEAGRRLFAEWRGYWSTRLDTERTETGWSRSWQDNLARKSRTIVAGGKPRGASGPRGQPGSGGKLAAIRAVASAVQPEPEQQHTDRVRGDEPDAGGGGNGGGGPGPGAEGNGGAGVNGTGLAHEEPGRGRSLGADADGSVHGEVERIPGGRGYPRVQAMGE